MLQAPDAHAPLLEVRDLHKSYVQKRGLFGRSFVVPALRGLSFTVQRGATLAISGESGSGKSTLAKCLAGIEPCDRGEVLLAGSALSAVAARDRMAAFAPIQIVFQDSASSLNPGFTAEEIVAEPLLIQRIGTAAERRRRAHALMEQVGLSLEAVRRRAMEFSGGQRQRLAVARALTLEPRILIFDEAFTGLDLLTRQQILQLLTRLQQERDLTYLHVSHETEWAARWATEAIVLAEGRLLWRKTFAPRAGSGAQAQSESIGVKA